MKKYMKDIKELYLAIKGKEYKKLTQNEKEFLKELQYQAWILKDFCRELSESEIISLINNYTNSIQLENVLRSKKIA